MRKRALSSSLSQYNAVRPASERYGATALTGYSLSALASDSNVQAPKADMSVPECVENYSKNITLVTQHNRALVCPSIQTLTALFRWSGAVSNIASKCPDPKTRAMQPARKRSDRASPRASFSGAILWCPREMEDCARYYISGPSTELSESVHLGRYRWNRSWRRFTLYLVASVVLKNTYFHIQIAPHHRRFLRFALEGTAYQYPVLLFKLAFSPRTFSKCMDTAPPPQSERDLS